MSTLRHRYRPAIRRALLRPCLPQVARLVRKLDRARDLETRLDLTEELYRFLAKHGLDFNATVFEAVDRFNANKERRVRAPGSRAEKDARIST